MPPACPSRPTCRGAACCPSCAAARRADWRTSMYYRYYHDPGDHNTRAHYGVRTRTHKLIYFWKKDQWELFDLVNDPFELHNLYGQPGQESAHRDAQGRARAAEAGGARRRPARERTVAERRRRTGGEAARQVTSSPRLTAAGVFNGRSAKTPPTHDARKSEGWGPAFRLRGSRRKARRTRPADRTYSRDRSRQRPFS